MNKKLVQISALLSILCFGSFGCYKTYYFHKAEFAKLQRSESDTVAINDLSKQKVSVTYNTNIFVRSKGGKRYQLTPFNFKFTESQLVSSDRDLLLELTALKSYEIDHFSTWRTVGLAMIGVAAAAGVIVAVIFTADEDKGFGEQ